MEWTPVESSQIHAVGYDADTSTLGLRFKKTKQNHHEYAGQEYGAEYHYANVGPLLYAELLSAESVGKFFGEHIKKHPEIFPYTKVA